MNPMDRSGSHGRCFLNANLRLESCDGGRESVISLITASDGTLVFEATGKLPYASFRQLRQAREVFQKIVQTTGQAIIVKHNAKQLAELQSRSETTAKWSIRWWPLFQSWLLR